MIERSVPRRSSRWSGTGTVIVEAWRAPLHHDVTAALADLEEPVLLEDAAGLTAGEDTQSTQPRPRAW